MTYEDEKIAELKKEKRRNKHMDIKTGVYIDDRFVTFPLRTIFENVKMCIPEDFIEMPTEVQMLKYPSVNRPQMILTSLDTKINFAFNVVEEHLIENQLITLAVQMKEVIKKTNPAVIFYRNEQGKLTQDQTIYMFDFKSYGIDETLYNMVAFSPTKEGILQAIFNCPECDSENWQEAAWQAFQTIDV